MKKLISIALAFVMLLSLAMSVGAEANAQTADIFLKTGDMYAKTAEEFGDYAADIQRMGNEQFNRSTNEGYPFEDGYMVVRGWFLTEGGPSGFAYTVNTNEADITDPSRQMNVITSDYYHLSNAYLKSAGLYSGFSNVSYNNSGFTLGIYVGDLENGTVNSIKLYGINSDGKYALIRDIKVSVPEFGWRHTEYDKLESEYVLEIDPAAYGGNRLSNPAFGFMSKKVWYTQSQMKIEPITGVEYLVSWQKKLTAMPLDSYDTIEVKYSHMEGSDGVKLSQKGVNIVVKDYDGNIYAESGILPDVDKSIANTSVAQGWAALTQTVTLTKREGVSLSGDVYWGVNTDRVDVVVVLVSMKMYTNKAEYTQKVQELDAQIAAAESDAKAIKTLLTAEGIELSGYSNEMLKSDLANKLSAYLNSGITVDALAQNSDGTYNVTFKHLDSQCVVKNVSVNVNNPAIVVGDHDITNGVMAIANADIELDKDDYVQEKLVSKLKELLDNDAVTVTVKNYTQKSKSATFDVEFTSGNDSYTLKNVGITLKPIFTPPAEGNESDKTDEEQATKDTESAVTNTETIAEDTMADESSEGGCKSSVVSVALIVTLVMAVLIFRKKRKVTE